MWRKSRSYYGAWWEKLSSIAEGIPKFFQLSGNFYEAIVALSHFTGWGLNEILDLDEEDFSKFYEISIELYQKE